MLTSLSSCLMGIGRPTDTIYPHFLGNEALTELQSISDLGVVVDSQLHFTEHIAMITQKGHQRANLIHRCFTSRDCSLLVKAFITIMLDR